MESILKNPTIECNRVLRNTLMLLALVFGFSALMSIAAILLHIPALHPLVTIGVYCLILLALHKNDNNALGVALCFMLTGWLGLTLGPMLSVFLVVNPMIIVNTFILTTLLFALLSGYSLISRTNFSFIGAWLSVSILAAFVTGILSVFFNLPVLGLVVSAAFVVLSSGVILWQLSEIIHGGETNYIHATVTLFVSIYNIFAGLLNILGYSNS